MIKTSLCPLTGSDFQDDFAAAVVSLWTTVCERSSCAVRNLARMMRSLVSMIGQVIEMPVSAGKAARHRLRRESGQYLLIALLAATVIGLQLRSLL